MGKPKERHQSYVGLVSPRPVLQINSIEGAAGILLVATDFSVLGGFEGSRDARKTGQRPFV